MVKPYDWPLEYLQGISSRDRLSLARLGIITNQDLLRQTSSAALKIALGQKLGLHLQYIEKWRAIAELGCVPKVGYQYGGLLLHSGIASIRQLAVAQPGPIHRNVLRLHVAQTRRRDLCPSCSEIKGWIQQAQQLVNYPN